VAKNEQEAARYFKLATDQGDPDAQYNYGWCLAEWPGSVEGRG
jgi:TPR repeat protein